MNPTLQITLITFGGTALILNSLMLWAVWITN